MTDERAERRYDAFIRWRARAAADGFAVPGDAALERAALSGVVDSADDDPVVASWKPTIDWMATQMKFGLLRPDEQIPDELAVPLAVSSQPPGPEVTSSRTVESSDLALLQDWRAKTAGTESVKDAHLRMIVNSPARTADELRASFPPLIGRFAEDIAAVLHRTVAATAMPQALTLTHDVDTSVPSSTGSPTPLQSVKPSTPTSTHEASVPASIAPEIEPGGFAPYDYGASSEVPSAAVINRDTNGVRVQWTARAGSVFRLVSTDESAPYSPDHARVVHTTLADSASDDVVFTHAVRHYQVWRNDGVSPEEAKRAQPLLHAFGAVVAPILEVDVRVDEQNVIGQWQVQPGTTRVQIFRIPLRSAAGASGDPRYRILSDLANLGGFVDTEAVPGVSYLYQFFAEAEVDAVPRLSSPISLERGTSPRHERIEDLAFELHDDLESPYFNLSWTVPPGGQVVVYRTERAPEAGIERDVRDASVLAAAHLPEESRLVHPITAVDGIRASMRDVPWPRGWTRPYFTAVTLLDGKAFVGNTVRGVRVPSVAHPKLTERVNRQLLTFEWPVGADIVLVFRGPTGLEAESAILGPAVEISHSDYLARGGVTFEFGELEPAGCDLHLVSVAFDEGNRVQAAPVTLHYDGILRLQYLAEMKRSLLGKVSVVISIVSPQMVLEKPPPFVLVYRSDRLPLTISDGTTIAMVRDGEDPGEPIRRFVPSVLTSDPGMARWRTDAERWATDVSEPIGFVRLFVDLPPDVLKRVALLDPPVDRLRVQSLFSRAQGAFRG